MHVRSSKRFLKKLLKKCIYVDIVSGTALKTIPSSSFISHAESATNLIINPPVCRIYTVLM